MRSHLSQGHPEAPLLIYVGRIGTEKKLDRLQRILDENPEARLAVVGTGPAEAELKVLLKNERVFFAGQMTGKNQLDFFTLTNQSSQIIFIFNSGDSLSQAFASADIFVMPSDTETLGFVVMEALASAIPVVGVAAGGLVDIIDDGVTGYLVSNDDQMAEFSMKVKHLIENPTLRTQFSEAATRWASQWSWEAATAKLRNIQYRKAIAIHKSRDHRQRHTDEISQYILKN
jgi:sulfoquinovosyltransferase